MKWSHGRNASAALPVKPGIEGVEGSPAVHRRALSTIRVVCLLPIELILYGPP
jgi:hypothetical protein